MCDSSSESRYLYVGYQDTENLGLTVVAVVAAAKREMVKRIAVVGI